MYAIISVWLLVTENSIFSFYVQYAAFRDAFIDSRKQHFGFFPNGHEIPLDVWSRAPN
jgi:hypothetical protein